MKKNDIEEFLGGEVAFWVEQDQSISIKAVTSYGDPVELTADEARNIGKRLMKLADKINFIDSNEEENGC